jgi:hypothetical protein
MSTAACPAFLTLSLLSLPAAAQVVVLTGDDLPAVVAAAPDGETIVIQSDATFVGTVSWSGKELTLRAGVGYAPVIQGSPDQPALRLQHAPLPGTEATLTRLRLVPGAQSAGVAQRPAVELTGSGSVGQHGILELELQQCVLDGDLRSSGTGEVDSYVFLDDTDVQGTIQVSGTGSCLHYVRLEEQSRAQEIRIGGTGDAATILGLYDSTVAELLRVAPIGDVVAQIYAVRTRFLGPVELLGTSTTQVGGVFESCLHRGSEQGSEQGSGQGTGLLVRDVVALHGVNLTITGFAVGLDAELPSDFANLALFDNGDDLAPVVLPSQIRRSLIEDGTYAAVNGNLGGSPWVDDELALLPGSLGIDAGDNGALFFFSPDLNGDPRIQDDDGDGIARINVGALETLGTCATAKAVVVNGSGSNPSIYTAATLPQLGQTYVGAVNGGPTTAATILAVGLPTPVVSFFPGVEGEILLDLSLFPFLQFSSGTHVLPIPSDLALCGVKVGTQALRVDLPQGVPLVRAGNGVRLTLGQ